MAKAQVKDSENVSLVRVYAHDLMPGDTMVASWRGGMRCELPIKWKVTSVEVVDGVPQPFVKVGWEDSDVIDSDVIHFATRAMFTVNRAV